MILLNGHSLTPARKVPVEAESIQLKERESTATLTPADMTGIGVNSWLRDEGEPGNGIVWRVKSIGQAFATATPTVQLEHAISTLKDTILFGEHKPAQITGNKNATTCTAEQAVRYVLARQSDWMLGSFSYGGVSNPYKFDGDTLFDCLETISNSLTDAWWSYDFSRYPFRLNITQKSANVQSEMRASRNLKTITKTIDKSGMYTRFYPIGKDDLHIDGDYVERNVSAYGVVSKVETDQSIDTKAELTRWANERLEMHAEPTVTIDVEGVELAEATGESMDKLTLGTVCRIPLPEFGTTIQERIVSLSYPDKVHQPEVVKVQLSNTRQDLTKILADAIKSGGRGGRTSSKQNKEDHAWFEDTNDHVAMCAKGIIGEDAQGNPNWVRLSEIVVNENGIYTQVQSVQNDIVVANTRIDQNENAITLEANRAIDQERTLSGQISVEAGKISQVVSAVGKDGEVTAASIVLAINEAGDSEARIDAEKVYIGNSKSTTVIAGKCSLSDVTADYIGAKIATMSKLTCPEFEGNVYASRMYFANGSTPYGSTIYQRVGDALAELQIEQDPDTGVCTLSKKSWSDAAWVVVGTFDHAVPTTLTGAWNSSGTFTVTASPQDATLSVTPNVHYHESTSTILETYVATYAGDWQDHGNAIKAYLVQNGSTIELNNLNVPSSSGSGVKTFAKISIPAATVSGSWNGSTWTATSSLGGSASVTPNVHYHAGASGTLETYIGTNAAGVWTDHGNAVKAYLVLNGTTVELNNLSVPSSSGSGVVTYAKYTLPPELSYEAGWKAGWDAYYNDSVDWDSAYKPAGATNYSVWTPRKIADFDYYNSPYGRGKGNNTSATSMKWFEYGGAADYSARTFRCTKAESTYPGSSSKIYTFTLEGNYSYNAGNNYTFYIKK